MGVFDLFKEGDVKGLIAFVEHHKQYGVYNSGYFANLVDGSLPNPSTRRSTLLNVAIDMESLTPKQIECLSIWIPALGAFLSPDEKLKDENDPLMTAAQKGNLQMVNILLPFYMKPAAEFDRFWGPNKAKLITGRVKEAINSVTQATPNAEAILLHMWSHVTQHNNNNIDNNLRQLMQTGYQPIIKDKWKILFPNVKIEDAASPPLSLASIKQSLREHFKKRDIKAFQADLQQLKDFWLKDSTDPEQDKRNLAHTLRDMSVEQEGEKGTMLAAAIQDPKCINFVSGMLSLIGPEQTTGEVDKDPLVFAAREVRPLLVQVLLPFYAMDATYWGDKHDKIQQCITAALDAIQKHDPDKIEDMYKLHDLVQPFRVYDSIFGGHADVLHAIGNKHSGKIRRILGDEAKTAFYDDTVTLEDFKKIVDKLHACHERFQYTRNEALKYDTTLTDLANMGLLSSMGPAPSAGMMQKFNYLLPRVLRFDQSPYDTVESRKALFACAKDPQVQRALIHQYNRYFLKSQFTSGLDLTREQINTLIVDIVTDPNATNEELSFALSELQLNLTNTGPGNNLNEIMGNALSELLVRDGDVDKSLFGYVCEKGLNSPNNKGGISKAAYMTLNSYMTDEQKQSALKGITVHESVISPLKPTTYVNSAIKGAAWMTALTTLAIVGVLVEACFIGNHDLQDKLSNLANGCWKGVFCQPNDANAVQEVGMLSCVGSLMLMGAVLVGGMAGAALKDTPCRGKL